MAVMDTSVTRLVTDHKRPWRTAALPFVEVDRPLGTPYGVLGSRWADTCGVYSTFASATAAGVTWEMALLGLASLASPPVSTFRTYAQVNATFASYNAVNTGGRTYEDLLEGR
jgi:hypothetical protein